MKQVVNTLAASANATLLEGKEDTDQTIEPPESCDDDDDDDNLNQLNDIVPVEKTNYEMIINELNAKVIRLHPQPPTDTVIEHNTCTSTSTNVIVTSNVMRTCKHTKRGHSRVNENLSKCLLCPNGLCLVRNQAVTHTPCDCTWHKSNYPDTNLYSV